MSITQHDTKTNEDMRITPDSYLGTNKKIKNIYK